MKWLVIIIIKHYNICATFIAIATLVAILTVRKRWPKLPVFFIVVGLATMLVVIFKINVPTIGSKFGMIQKIYQPPYYQRFLFNNL